MTTAWVLVLALLLDALLGEPEWLWSRVPHPAVLMGRAISWCDATLNTGTFRKGAGVLTLFVLISGAALVGWGLGLAGPVVEVVVGAILLAQKSLVQHVSAVASALRTSLEQGRNCVGRIVSRDTQEMDDSQVARSAIESAAENLSDGVMAPAFWLLIGGLPGVLIYKVVNTADSMIGYRTPKYEQFGWAAARTDDLLNLIPARFTALMIALISGQKDWRAVMQDARRHRSPNAGWPEAAMSRALGIALSGPRAYDGKMQDFAWVNPAGRKSLGPDDIDAAVAMLWKAWGGILVFVLVIAVVV